MNQPPQNAVRSMTGFARASQAHGGIAVEVEVRSVNHRFFELSFKGPKCYGEFERDARSVFQKLHRRGRIDLSVNRRVLEPAQAASAPVDEGVLDELVRTYCNACRRYGVKGDHLAGFIARAVLRDTGRSEEAVEVSEGEMELVMRVLGDASEALAVMREQEGAWLADDITSRLAMIEESVERIRPWASEIPARFKERLQERLEKLSPGLQVDPERLAQEVAFLADRTDVSEELSRLGSHIQQFRSTLAGHPDGIGRRLDFLIQEFGREFNTIGSKAQDARIQSVVVEAKSELEKIREQVQNVE